MDIETSLYDMGKFSTTFHVLDYFVDMLLEVAIS